MLVTGPLGSIRGSFVDEAGLLPEAARPELYLSLREEVSFSPTWEENGDFAFELLRPGRYRFTAKHAGQLLFTNTVVLAPGADLDLGRITSAPPGSLVLAFGVYPSTSEGAVLDRNYGIAAFVDIVEGRLGVASLPPGDWLLDFEAGDEGRVCVPFTIHSGERTEPACRSSGRRTLALLPLRRARVGEPARGAARRARRPWLGKNPVRRFWPEAGAGPSLLVTLPVGTFSLGAETDTGLALHTSFDVPALVPQDSPLEFGLR